LARRSAAPVDKEVSARSANQLRVRDRQAKVEAVWIMGVTPCVLPNGSRLSCGRPARGRKEFERQTKRLASEATQFLPTCERPAASSAC
jgi:hypothetical protein